MFLNNYPWIEEEIIMEIRKDFKLNDFENFAYQNLWDIDKALLIGIYSLKYI